MYSMPRAHEVHDRVSLHSLFPCVLVTRVCPIFLVWKVAGAFTSYQSFLVKGSTLANRNQTMHMLSKRDVGHKKKQSTAIRPTSALAEPPKPHYWLIRASISRPDSHLLLGALLPLGQSLVLAHRHAYPVRVKWKRMIFTRLCASTHAQYKAYIVDRPLTYNLSRISG